jgi:hypothetical protein
MKTKLLFVLLSIVHASACASSPHAADRQVRYVDESGIWSATVSMQEDGDAHLSISSNGKTLDLVMAPSEGDLEMIGGPNDEDIPAHQFVLNGRCWATLAISLGKEYLRFDQKDCGIAEDEILFRRSR